MTENLTNREIINLHEGLTAVSQLANGVKFAYLVARNLRVVGDHVRDLRKSLAPSVEYSAYERKRLELGKQYGEKNENGKPALETRGNTMQIRIADVEGFSKAMEKLDAEYREAIEKHGTRIRAYERLLDETADSLATLRIPMEVLPAEITPSQLEPLLPLIDP